MLLVGDVGGTKTKLALFEEKMPIECIKEETYASKDFKELSDAIFSFIKPDDPIKMACFGIAGPIRENRVKTTNLPWVIDAKELSKSLKEIDVFLINDLQANAWGLRALKEDQFFTLNKGNPTNRGNKALISAGTGLGEAGLYFDGKHDHPFASEGGHAGFGPNSALEVELAEYLIKKHGHASWERVVSGMGIYEIYQFLKDKKNKTPTSATAQKIKEKDPSKVISEAAMKKEDKLCERVMQWFLSLYGAEAGNAALKFLALGGVYIGGGIAPKVIDLIQEESDEFPSFLTSFLSKGRMKGLMESIPLKIVLEDRTALLGAVEYLFEKMEIQD